MGKTLDIGLRIELCSMDPHCHNISLALYRRDVEGTAQLLVHSYSHADGTDERVAFVRQGLIDVVGLIAIEGSEWLRFPCDGFHQRAVKRAFLDICKLAPDSPLAPKPTAFTDKKAGCELTVAYQGDGVYEITAAEESPATAKRTKAVATGFAKLCEMDTVDNHPNRVSFSCKSNHDELIGALSFRAQNVRAAMREEEMSSSRGVLAAPSQQK